MSLPSVFIDGHAGTVGLRIHDALAGRDDLELLALPDRQRKDPVARREFANRADLVVLCLPDDAAREAVAWIDDAATRVIDGSTAHRVDPDWVYGLVEMRPEQREFITRATRVSIAGCYPVVTILGLRPLIESGLLRADAPIAIHGLSGYSGGGRAKIELWEDAQEGLLNHSYEAPYALDRVHKHIPEMTHYSGLEQAPQFTPAVGPFFSGMRVQIPLHAGLLERGATAESIWEALHESYSGEPFVRIAPLRAPLDSNERSFDPRSCNGTNDVELQVIGNPGGHVLLVGILDNLGKGAAGGAIQCLNLMLGRPESEGLGAQS